MADRQKSIRIDLNYKYVIDVEPLCYTLKKRYMGKNKTGEVKEMERVCGYFGDIRGAIEKYIYLAHIDRASDKAVSLMEYTEMIEQASKNALRGLQKELERFEVK